MITIKNITLQPGGGGGGGGSWVGQLVKVLTFIKWIAGHTPRK